MRKGRQGMNSGSGQAGMQEGVCLDLLADYKEQRTNFFAFFVDNRHQTYSG